MVLADRHSRVGVMESVEDVATWICVDICRAPDTYYEVRLRTASASNLSSRRLPNLSRQSQRFLILLVPFSADHTRQPTLQ